MGLLAFQASTLLLTAGWDPGGLAASKTSKVGCATLLEYWALTTTVQFSPPPVHDPILSTGNHSGLSTLHERECSRADIGPHALTIRPLVSGADLLSHPDPSLWYILLCFERCVAHPQPGIRSHLATVVHVSSRISRFVGSRPTFSSSPPIHPATSYLTLKDALATYDLGLTHVLRRLCVFLAGSLNLSGTSPPPTPSTRFTLFHQKPIQHPRTDHYSRRSIADWTDSPQIFSFTLPDWIATIPQIPGSQIALVYRLWSFPIGWDIPYPEVFIIPPGLSLCE
jgi:hypothetical protein